MPKAPYMYFFFFGHFISPGKQVVLSTHFHSFFLSPLVSFQLKYKTFHTNSKDNVDTLKRYIKKKTSPLNISGWIFFKDKGQNNTFPYSPSKYLGGLHVSFF